VDTAQAQEFLRTHHRAILATFRRDGRPQLSPVTVGLDHVGRVVVSTREAAIKVHNMRRDPRVSACVFSDQFFGAPWVQVEGEAEILSLPDALEPLVDYYRGISGEHPDWDDYRRAMHEQRRVLVRFEIIRAGPNVAG
jgi:PPOX class probable F420-dependent enzyme